MRRGALLHPTSFSRERRYTVPVSSRPSPSEKGGIILVIYLDLMIFLNFSVDLLLLLCSNRLAGYPSRPGRLLSAAALGGVYSGLCLLPSLSFLGNPLWYLICLGLMSAAAFGLGESALRRGAVFFLLSMAMGGMALAMHRSRLDILLLDALGLWLLTRISFGGQTLGTRYVPVTVVTEGRTVSFTALLDTGNQLRDPITGESVLVVSPRQAQLLTGLSAGQLLHPLEVMADPPVSGLRLIPYAAIGTGSGMLLGKRFSQVTIGTHTGQALLAFAPEGLGSSGTVQALTGGIS